VGASLIFFAYIGFDAISTGRECRRPSRDLPIVSRAPLYLHVIYVAVALVLTVWCREPARRGRSLAAAFAYVGADVSAGVVSFCAVVSMSAVLLVFPIRPAADLPLPCRATDFSRRTFAGSTPDTDPAM